jgi:hypothetical protein
MPNTISTIAVKTGLDELAKTPRFQELARGLVFNRERFIEHLATVGSDASFDESLEPVNIEEPTSYEWAGRTLIALLAVERAGLTLSPN